MSEKTDYAGLPLGKSVAYPEHYDAGQLQAIARSLGRADLSLDTTQLRGSDVWNAYELSWLDARGKPQVACAQFVFSAASPNMVESKSFKLYLNSLNQSRFDSMEQVGDILKRDLSAVAGCEVAVRLLKPAHWQSQLAVAEPTGVCLDEFDPGELAQGPSQALLSTGLSEGGETYYSNLFRSRCPVTGQPDWASVEVSIAGRLPEPASLLAYLLSFRSNNEFHEQCAERIYNDIMQVLAPNKLSVYLRFTRRGGLDINPLRSNYLDERSFVRLPRQ